MYRNGSRCSSKFVGLLAVVAIACGSGCVDQAQRHTPSQLMGDVPDTRTAVQLPEETEKTHRDVMMQHLETVQVIVHALAEEDFTLAKGVTEVHLGFFARRHAAAQHAPPAYTQLALAHVQATKDLSAIIPSKDMKQILPRLNGLLRTCMACHLEYKVAVKPAH